jgi:hypothetical protein
MGKCDRLGIADRNDLLDDPPNRFVKRQGIWIERRR